MRSSSTSIHFYTLLIVLLAIPSTVQAQIFQAYPDKAGPAKTTSYLLDTDNIHAYAERQLGAFPLTLSFSDTLQWGMQIERYDVRSKNYRLVTSNGIVQDATTSDVITYKGTLDGNPESQVRLTITDGYFRAFVRESSDRSYYLDMQDASNSVTILQGDPEEHPAYCGSGMEHYVTDPSAIRKSDRHQHHVHRVLAPYEAEIAFVVDRLGFEQYDSLNELEQELVTIMNYTDAYYSIHDLTYKLTEIYVIEDLQSQPWEESSNAGQMLDNFTSWASQTNALQPHDVATLWSGIDFGSTIGIAWVGAIGSSYKQNVVNFPKGRERRNSNVHAHELGHNWGSGHVNNGGWMMSAFLSSANEEAQWHQSTIDAFPGYVQDAIQHLDDVGGGDGGDGGDGGGGDGGDGGDGGSTVLNINYSQLTITDEENGNDLLDPGETANINLLVENLDSTPISNLQITMTQDNNRARNHITINNNNPVTVELIDGSKEVTVRFNVSLSLAAPADRSYRFLFELNDGTRTSEATLSITSGTEFLPVELTSFTALEGGGGVMLQWETASEVNNAGFEVEVQRDGGAFQQIGFVEGGGTILTAQRYSYFVQSAGPGTFGFRLRQIDFDGTFEYSDVVTLNVLPDAYSLKQNYPNPFNPQTRIEFHMPASGDVSLEVYDMLGRRVAVLVDTNLQAGQHEATFDAQDLSNGTYIYKLKAGGYVEAKTMILMK